MTSLAKCLSVRLWTKWLWVRVQLQSHKKFAISLQYLKKAVNDDVDFLHADKHESFLQIDNMIFDGDGQSFPKFSK